MGNSLELGVATFLGIAAVVFLLMIIGLILILVEEARRTKR